MVLVSFWAAPANAAQKWSEHPKAQLTWWQANYPPAEGDLVKKAHAVFARVLHAAGSRPGVTPRLYITKNNLFGVSQAIAIPDGGIVVSQAVLDLCYRDLQRGDDRLAFVLGHEIAHQLKEDFSHLRFFDALEAFKSNHPTPVELPRNDDGLGKEEQADMWGILYASMAGFNTRAIVSDNESKNFFEEWVQAMEPQRVGGMPSPTSPDIRAGIVKGALHSVLEQMDVFTLGLQFYHAGMYPQAIQAFEKFLQAYPSREVYHNLATSHHQRALEYYRAWKRQDLALPFQLSMAIDPVTRAQSGITRKSSSEEEAAFHFHIDEAIRLYNEAIKLDPAYVLAYNNLGCALILTGDEYEAIATLQKAVKREPHFLEAHNNLGVAFWYNKRPDEARKHLTEAHTRNPRAEAPLFNLGRLAHAEGQAEAATRYWMAYLQQDSTSDWAKAIHEALSLPMQGAPPPGNVEEALGGLQIGLSTNKIPPEWGQPVQTNTVSLGKAKLTMAVYPQGLLVVSQDELVLLLTALEGFTGTSSRGIAPGRTAADVLAAYGRPERIVHMTQGASWSYKKTHGIAFQLRDDTVVSWVLF
jgi:tetratricopeptide (TPR) repeat protein